MGDKMTEKIQIMVFKKTGKFYTGDSNKWYDLPDEMEPWDGSLKEFVTSKEVISPKGFIFVTMDHPDNKKFFTRLIHGDE